MKHGGFRHRVRARKYDPPAPPPLPRSRWQGHTFVDADGCAYEVVWNGDRRGADLIAQWPADHSTLASDGLLHLKKAGTK